jgi:hypothetical protein
MEMEKSNEQHEDTMSDSTANHRKMPVKAGAYRPKEAAEYLGISTRTLSDIRKRGEIVSFKLNKAPQGARLFPVVELQKWLARRVEEGQI